MRNIAVVLAGGTGRRFGTAVPKQFLTLGGREVVEHSLDLFDAHEAIDEVAVVVHPDWRSHMESLTAHDRWTKLGAILDGGAERWQSSWAAVEYYSGQWAEGRGQCTVNLLLHDAARPWLSADTVSRVVEALESHQAVAVAVPSTDTLFRVADGCIVEVPPREDYYCAQTPQAFRLDLLSSAFQSALHDPGFCATDDCGVLLRYRHDVPICIVQGTPENNKITYSNDIMLP